MNDALILLFGFSRTALEIATKLKKQGYAFRLVDYDPAALVKAQKEGFDLIVCDYGNDDALESLGIAQNVGFVFCLFDDDVHNVFLTLSVRAIDPNVPIIATTHTKDAVHKLEIAGATTILDPYQITGKKIYKLITQPEVMQIVETTIFGEEDVNMAQLTVTETSPLNGTLLSQYSAWKAYNMLLLGLHDKEFNKEFIFITEGHTHKLDAGDVLVVIGSMSEIRRFKTDFCLE